MEDASRQRPPGAGGAAGRGLWLDGVRGLCLLVMMLFHLPRNVWQAPLRGLLGFVPVAEGFVLIAGVTSGLYYGGLLRDRGPDEVRRRALQRARRIYLTHALILSLLWIAGAALPRWSAAWRAALSAPLQASWLALLRGLLLLEQPWVLDILPMYCLFVLLTPPALRLAASGRGYLLAAASALCWFLAQTALPRQALGWLRLPRTGFFSLLGWQALFFFGLLAGAALARRGPGARLPRWLVALCVAGAVAAQAARHLGAPPLLDRWPLFARQTLQPLRLLVFLSLAGAVAGLAALFPRTRLLRPLAYLGRRSLEVYAFSTLISYAAIPYWWRLPPGWRAPLALLLAASLYLPALWQARRRART